MLLNELTGVKAQALKTAGEIISLLKKQHHIKVTTGSYGVVLLNPAWDYVVKFFPKDDCYLKFVDYCLKHKNKHLPNFKKPPIKMKLFFKRETDVTVDKFYAVKIEKLTKIPTDLYRKTIYKMILLEFQEAYKHVIGTSKEDEFLKSQGLLEYKDLANLVFDLIELKGEGGNCHMDLHEYNVMMRGDTIVIVDPYGAFDVNNLPLTSIAPSVELTVDRTEDLDLKKTVDTMAQMFNAN